MSFLAPGMFWLALLLPAVVLLYLLKLKRQEVVVSSLLLWRKSIDDMKANAPFQRLRNRLLLWLQLLVLALLIMGLARPMLNVKGFEGQQMIVLLDTSASMKATDVSPNRMAAAKRAVRAAIDDLSRGDSMMLITFAGKASVRTTLTSDTGLLRRAVEAASPTDTQTRIHDALKIASSVARQARNPELLILSDGQIADLAEATRMPCKVTFVPVGKRARNVGVTLFDIRSSFDERSRPSAFVKVQNFGDEPVDTVLKLANNGALVEARELQLAPGKATSVSMDELRLNEGLVEAALDIDDDLAADNHAWCVLMPQRRISVLLVTEGNYFLDKALLLERDVLLTQVSPQSYTSGEGHDVIIFDRWHPTTLPGGKCLFVGVVPPMDCIAMQGEVQAPIVLDYDRTHPLSRYLTFAGINIAKAAKMRLSKGARALVESRDTPLIAVHSGGRSRTVVVGFDLYESDWPLRVSFPLFVSNAAHWLSGRRPGAATEKYATGDAVAIRAPESASGADVVAADGKRHHMELERGRDAYFSQTDQAGVYRIEFGGGAHTPRPIAVNLLSAAESNTRPAQSIELAGKMIPAAAEGGRTNREIWRYFALAGLLFLLAEWYVYSRRVWL